MPRNKYQRFTDIVDGIVEKIIRIPKDMGGKSRILKGERLKALKLSVEKLIRDSIAIKHNRSIMSLASIRKGRDSYLPSRYNKHLTYRIHVERAYNGMIWLGYIDEVIKGASSGLFGVSGPEYLETRYKTIDIEPFNSISLLWSFIKGIVPNGAYLSLSKSSLIGFESI